MKRSILLVFAVGLLVLANAGFAQELNLEKADGRIWVLKSCDHVHAIDGESKCTNYHVIIAKSAEPGAEITLNGQPYVIQWMGSGYYTASGRVIQKVDGAGLGDLRVLEVRPNSGLTHQASWQDLDGDGELSVSDAVTIDGRQEPIVDVRLNVRVVPAR